jgi:hypothetical protein
MMMEEPLLSQSHIRVQGNRPRGALPPGPNRGPRSPQTADIERLALDIALDRQRLTKLERLNLSHYRRIEERSSEP